MFFVARCFGWANYIWYLKDPDAVTGIFSCTYRQFQQNSLKISLAIFWNFKGMIFTAVNIFYVPCP